MAAAASLVLMLPACNSPSRDAAKLDDARTKLEADLHLIVKTLDAASPASSGTSYDCNAATVPGRSTAWHQNVTFAAPPSASSMIQDHVLPEFRKRGWQISNWSGQGALRYRLSHNGSAIMITMKADGTGNISLGGITACVS